MSTVLDARWLAALRARADQPPRAPRVPLLSEGGARLGSVEPGFFNQVGLQGAQRLLEQLQKQEHGGQTSWRLHGDVTEGLNRIARALHQAGLAGAWRGEQLAVCDPHGVHLGTVERAAVRSLGIATTAIHLVGWAPDGRVWVQQRALTKDNDPGLWDTLAGGLVSADDALDASLLTALARETWEEAGLRIEDLQHLARGPGCTERLPSRDGAGAGYIEEALEWFSATVPDGMVPANQDGEVAQFACVTRAELAAMLMRDEFTLEAALVLQAAAFTELT